MTLWGWVWFLHFLDDCLEPFLPTGHATEDTFVAKHHSERLAAAYAGDHNLITFRGDHNSVRCTCWCHVFFLLS